MPEKINTQDVMVDSRMRKDLGEIDQLAKSIKENGLINPITLLNENGRIKLIAGERRFTALKKLGVLELLHAEHFLWRDDLANDSYGQTAVELEENIRRKALTWHEEVIGKQRLLEHYQRKFGPPSGGAPTRQEKLGLKPQGFGVRKLAEMLNESATQTSEDLSLAALVVRIPQLKQAASKEDARKELSKLLLKTMITNVNKQTTITSNDVQIYHGDFKTQIKNVASDSVDLVYVDLPYGASLNLLSKHQGSILDYHDERGKIVGDLHLVALESFRILRNDRFAVFYFGFNYYPELLDVMSNIGFSVDPVPYVWDKRTNSTEDPYRRYARSYDAALVVQKGIARFVRPGKRNLSFFQPLTTKLHIAQQPIELVQNFIEDMTIAGQTICDFMCGSGTTGEAALRLQRKVILIEENEDSYKFTLQRIENVCKQLGIK